MESISQTFWHYLGYPTHRETLYLLKRKIKVIIKKYEIDQNNAIEKVENLHADLEEFINHHRKNNLEINEILLDCKLTPLAQAEQTRDTIAGVLAGYLTISARVETYHLDKDMYDVLSNLVNISMPLYGVAEKMMKFLAKVESVNINKETFQDHLDIKLNVKSIDTKISDLKSEILQKHNPFPHINVDAPIIFKDNDGPTDGGNPIPVINGGIIPVLDKKKVLKND